MSGGLSGIETISRCLAEMIYLLQSGNLLQQQQWPLGFFIFDIGTVNNEYLHNVLRMAERAF